ncbi:MULTISPECIES: TetR/AcrR family transcriptional regulator [unclassified Mesorhizobium]|uniref:TetR/AcrR family transcriptional regulator n=1 Tax=unclassified Mesorhizobium TaxID=325217 RepID=UPI00241710DF|nr:MULTISPECIES: TetR/AcrR family transcriptional regulator [unclassified Mesorhizobium]MDG4895921.1 TetR/AcrR family transcriptional regulator [Mesorhizobium sp. WSM4976]
MYSGLHRAPMVGPSGERGQRAVKRSLDRKTKIALEPRKQPRQQRSSKVVDRILDAALILTREQGTKTPTTLAIAQRAGLSVGSVYQYFPNKEAILLELGRRWLSSFPEVIAKRIKVAPPTNREEFRREVRKLFIDTSRIYLDNATLMPVIEAISGNADLRPIQDGYDKEIIALYAAWLQHVNPALEEKTAKRLGLVMMEVGHACRLVGLKRDRKTFDLIEDDVEAMWLALVTPYLNLD